MGIERIRKLKPFRQTTRYIDYAERKSIKWLMLLITSRYCAVQLSMATRLRPARKRRSLGDAVGHSSVRSTLEAALNLAESMAVHRP